MTSSYRRTGFLLSALLHLTLAAAFVTQINHSSEKNNDDPPLPLTLAMFEETKSPGLIPEIAPEPSPVIPAKAEPEKIIPTAKIPRPVIKKPGPKPTNPLEDAIKPVVQPEMAINNNKSLAKTVPVIETPTNPVIKQEATPAPRFSAQQESLKRRYIKMLLKRIHRKKHYPRKARRNYEEGEVLVSFVIGKSGEISRIRVKRSSGYTRLDQAAIRTIMRSTPLPPPPNELEISDWKLAIPIAFNLRK